MQYLLVRGLTCLGYEDGIPIMSTIVCMNTYHIEPMVNQDLRLSYYRYSSSYYIAWTLNLERILDLN